MRNIDLKSVRPAELHSPEFDTADRISAGRTDHGPMFQH